MIHKLPKWVWLGGAVLTFSSGMVNAIAFLGFSHQGVTHVTGLVSHLSIALLNTDGSRIQQTLCILLSFLGGAILSGFIIRDAHLKMGRRYGFALGLESLLLLVATYEFSQQSLAGDYLAAMAAGLQNALVSSYSGAVLRTTHLTGMMTDLGVLIGHRLRGVKMDYLKMKLFLILIFSFIGGGILGAASFHFWNNTAMLIPALIVGASSFGYILIHRQLKANEES